MVVVVVADAMVTLCWVVEAVVSGHWSVVAVVLVGIVVVGDN